MVVIVQILFRRLDQVIKKYLNTKTGAKVTAVQWGQDNLKEIKKFCKPENVFTDKRKPKELWVNVDESINSPAAVKVYVWGEVRLANFVIWNGYFFWIVEPDLMDNGTYVDITGLKV